MARTEPVSLRQTEVGRLDTSHVWEHGMSRVWGFPSQSGGAYSEPVFSKASLGSCFYKGKIVSVGARNQWLLDATNTREAEAGEFLLVHIQQLSLS